MASLIVDDLKCSICLSTYMDPVTLPCGHSFCMACINHALNTQVWPQRYSCPECRRRFSQRPELVKNWALCTLVTREQSKQNQPGIFCTYCDTSVPAVKSCVQCESSLCDTHLKRHNTSLYHDLMEPTNTFQDRKCSAHKEILKYYCTADGACICISCWVAGDHKGHQVELLDEAAEKKKVKLRDVTGKLTSQTEETERRIQNLAGHRTQEKGKAAAVTGRVTELFGDIRRKLDDVEKRILTEVTRQEEMMSQSVSKKIQNLEKKKDALSKEIQQMEDFIKDPISILKKKIINDASFKWKFGFCDYLGFGDRLDEEEISQILDIELFHFTDSLKDLKIKRHFSVLEKSDISLDIKSTSNNIIISADLKTATNTDTQENRPDGREVYKYGQVLSTQSFSSGRHYWEVDVSGAEEWFVGVVYHSIEKEIINGKQPWERALDDPFDRFPFGPDKTHEGTDVKASIKTIGISLDYEAGCLRFYHLCDPITRLYSIHTKFKEPLHVAFYLFPGSCIRILQKGNSRPRDQPGLYKQVTSSDCMKIHGIQTRN